MADIASKIVSILETLLASRGLSLWDLEFKKSGSRWLLRVYIDRTVDGGVTLDDCEAVSRELSTLLDVDDIIPHAYTLEVSSPGLDRTLKTQSHFARYSGSMAQIKTFSPIRESRAFQGRLRGVEGDIVKIELADSEVVEIPIENISKASLLVEF